LQKKKKGQPKAGETEGKKKKTKSETGKEQRDANGQPKKAWLHNQEKKQTEN